MESICVTCPTGIYRRRAELRVRPVWEWDACVVLDPEAALLVTLDLHATLILGLCDGRDSAAIAAAYRAAIGPHADAPEAGDHLAIGLEALRRERLVEFTSAVAPATSPAIDT